MPHLELYTLWAAIGFYAVACILAIIGVAFSKQAVSGASVMVAAAAVVSHGVSLGARWVRLGHGPAIGFFEVASGLVFLGVLAYVALAWFWPGLRLAGAGVLPVALLVISATLLANPEARSATGALASAWLVVHVLFANLAFGCYAAASVLAVGQIMRESRRVRFAELLRRLPPSDELDTLTFRFVGAGLLLQGVMIVSGAIWANQAWGRYWGWDPIETWSLAAWVVYALYLHLTLTLGWHGRRAAWVIICALTVITFSLLGVPIVYKSIHGAYLRF